MMAELINVSTIQRFCVHDGPGIRTVVFLAGCPLKCKWCQNPETYSYAPRLMFNSELCQACGLCIEVCPEGAISFTEEQKIWTDPRKCKRHFACVEVCPYQARMISSRSYTLEALYKELMKDAVFFKTTQGGITLSGGEPMLYPELCRTLLAKIKVQGIHTTIETSGHVKWENFEQILPVVDLFLYDIKLFDPAKHLKWTGQDNQIIHENLGRLVQRGAEVIVRVPLIPDVNDDREFEDIVNFVTGFESLRELHIMPFHQLGSSKYGLLGQEYELADLQEENDERVEACKAYAEGKGLRVSIGGAGFKR
jgi:pyruvate formate lyase activating enzyme